MRLAVLDGQLFSSSVVVGDPSGHGLSQRTSLICVDLQRCTGNRGRHARQRRIEQIRRGGYLDRGLGGIGLCVTGAAVITATGKDKASNELISPTLG
jgi:hypothetical protein